MVASGRTAPPQTTTEVPRPWLPWFRMEQNRTDRPISQLMTTVCVDHPSILGAPHTPPLAGGKRKDSHTAIRCPEMAANGRRGVLL